VEDPIELKDETHQGEQVPSDNNGYETEEEENAALDLGFTHKETQGILCTDQGHYSH